MAGDARISTGLPAHPKTKKLIRRLGHAGGWYLLCLILWTATNRSTGDLTGMSDEDIELAIDWSGDPGALTKALSALGFLDGEEGTRTFHDWEEHNPWVAGAEMRSEKARYAALCKTHGAAQADLLMPEYASRRVPTAAKHPARCTSNTAPGTAPSTPNGAPSMPAALPEAATGMPQAGMGTAPSPSPSPSPSPTPTLGAELPSSIDADPAAVVLIPLVDGTEFPVAQGTIDEWATAFPAVDIVAELRKARVWCLDNPKSRKTKTGARKFLNSWLGRTQDRAGGARRSTDDDGPRKLVL